MDNELPKLGTTEAAVRSCVSVIAAVTAQREDVLAYWLDLYYQVRCAYEAEIRNEDPAVRNLIRKSRAAGRILPEVRRRTLPEAVLGVMCRIEEFTRGGLQDLKQLAADGTISAEEICAYGDAIAQLRDVIRAAYELEFAEEAEP